MGADWLELMAAADAVRGKFVLRRDSAAGSVGAAILTASGRVYTGICIELPCGLGFCAEVAAIAEMLKARETHVAAVVAVGGKGKPIPPCGRCRETIALVDERNLDCRIAIGIDLDVSLRELLPRHWLAPLDRARPTTAPSDPPGGANRR